MQPNPQQQQQQQRRSNVPRMPMMYPNNLPPVRYGGPANYQQQIPPGAGGGGGGGGAKHHPRGGGNRNSRGGSAQIHRQQRPAPGSRYHPYPSFRQPLSPQQRFHRPSQMAPRTPAALMGTPPGMSQSEYEPIHSAQVQRDKEKLLRQGNVLAPSNTNQFLIRDHNRQTPSSIATPTPSNEESPSTSQTNPTTSSYDKMFDVGDVDAQSDDTETTQDIAFVGVDPASDDDFNDIYYQCRYERYAAFSRANLLNEVLSLCANIDRLQHEKSEVEKRLRDAQQHILELTSANATLTHNTTNGNDDRSAQEEPVDQHPQVKSPSSDRIEVTPVIEEEEQTSSTSQPAPIEQQEILPSSVVEDAPMETREQEQEIVHD